MRQLLVLLKYGLGARYSRRDGGTRRSFGFVALVVSSFIIGFPLGSLFFELFKVLSAVRISTYTLSTLLMVQWSILSGLLFLISFVPSLINSFARNDEIQFLLTFPIERWAIVAYQMVLTLALQPLTVVMYLFVFPAYVVACGGNLFYGFLVAILFVFLMLSLSFLLSCVFGLFLERSQARRISTAGLIVTIVLFFLAMQFLPNYARNLVNQNISFLSHALTKFMHPLNIFAWPVRALNEPFYLLIMLIVCPTLFLLSVPVAEKLSFEQKVSFRSSRRIWFGAGKVFWKDLKILARNEQSLFTLLYPVAFGVLFGVSFRNFVPAMMLFTTLSGSYVAYNSAMLTKQELSVWPLPVLLPVKESNLLLPKLIVPSSIYLALFSAMLVFFKFWFSLPSTIFLLVPVMSTVFLFSSTLGMLFYLKQPFRSDPSNPSRVLTSTRVLTIQGIVLLLSLICLMPFQTSVRSALVEIVGVQNVAFLIFYGVPFGCAVLLAIFSKRLFNRVKQLFQEIE
ncbi:MAG: hypothetical protein ACPLTP_05990 [Thermotoga caldifontis]|uniref:hypothetical protein n=1 Tax=Thermotoga caldifontis TaxID=1508419 RepID=UPI003C7C5EF6